MEEGVVKKSRTPQMCNRIICALDDIIHTFVSELPSSDTFLISGDKKSGLLELPPLLFSSTLYNFPGFVDPMAACLLLADQLCLPNLVRCQRYVFRVDKGFWGLLHPNALYSSRCPLEAISFRSHICVSIA